MGLRYHMHKYADLEFYDPEFNEDGTEKHITCDGARFHVMSWGHSPTGIRCSNPKCELNARFAASCDQPQEK